VALRRLARESAAAVATNGEDHRQLAADPAVAPHLHLIPIGSNIPAPALADDAAAERQRLRMRLGAGADQVLLAYFGLVSASKGLDTLLDALAELERRAPGRYRLLLVGGEASRTDRLAFGPGDGLAGELWARGLAGRVTATGALPPEAVAAHLRAADVAVLPYRDGASWRRGSLLAALAQGLPAVTTAPRPGYDADGRLPALRDGENALLAPPGDVGALAQTIERVAADGALRARLAAGGRELARAFSWDGIAARHLALYEAVLQQERARSATRARTGERLAADQPEPRR